jgi:hypothetical protein
MTHRADPGIVKRLKRLHQMIAMIEEGGPCLERAAPSGRKRDRQC